MYWKGRGDAAGAPTSHTQTTLVRGAALKGSRSVNGSDFGGTKPLRFLSHVGVDIEAARTLKWRLENAPEAHGGAAGLVRQGRSERRCALDGAA